MLRASPLPLPVFSITGIILASILGVAVAILPLAVSLSLFAALIILALVLQSPIIIMIVMLVLAPLRTLIATESPLLLPLDIGQLTLGVFLCIWLIYRIIHQQHILRANASRVLFILLFAVIAFALNAWTANSLNAWLTEWLKWLTMLLLVWIILMSEKHNWQWLVYGVVLAALANGIIGLYIFFGGSGADHLLIGGHYFRAFGTFGQPNPFGGFMGIILPIAIMGTYSQLQLILRHYHSFHQIPPHLVAKSFFFASAALIIFAGLIASWSRGAWLGFIISISVVAFAIPRNVKTSLSVLISVIVLLALLWFTGVLPKSIIDRLTTSASDFITVEDIRGVDITTENYAVAERLAHWQAAINMASVYPFTGVGLGNYELVYPQYRLLNWKESLGHAHNYYLNILAEAGIIGLCTYSIFWIVTAYLTWKTRQHPDLFARAIAIGLLGSWTYIAVHSVFDNLYVNNLFLHMGILLGILASLHQQIWHNIIVE